MAYPSWVPAGVAQRVEALVEGWSRSEERIRIRLAEIGIIANIRRGRRPHSLQSACKRMQARLQDRINHTRDGIACIERLTRSHNDGRDRDRQELYERWLSDLDDLKVVMFLIAACGAADNYTRIRRQLREARLLRQEIIKAARELSRQIRTLESLDVGMPKELVSTRALLRMANPSHPDDIDAWEILRPHILGDELNSSVEVCRAWGSAPDLADLLEAAAMATENYITALPLHSRQKGEKTDAIRVFAGILTGTYELDLTTRIKRAMAIAATIAINDPDIVVTYDDVRKALNDRQPRPGKVAPEK
jgi:hypothetical protein